MEFWARDLDPSERDDVADDVDIALESVLVVDEVEHGVADCLLSFVATEFSEAVPLPPLASRSITCSILH